MRIKRQVLIGALGIAADEYDKMVLAVRREPGHDRLAAAFSDQSREARHLASAIDNEATIELED